MRGWVSDSTWLTTSRIASFFNPQTQKGYVEIKKITYVAL
jgi:hypothetical protein